MSKPIAADLFVEDSANEQFVKHAILRLARESSRQVVVQVRSARGGHGKALTELVGYQRLMLDEPPSTPDIRVPDLIVIAIDANCKGLNEALKDIRSRIDRRIRDCTVIACPDPHIERWYLADPDSFAQAVGIRPILGRRKCERNHYKHLLSKAIADAGHPVTLGGIEFAMEIVEAMDFYKAAHSERSLKLFLRALEARLR